MEFFMKGIIFAIQEVDFIEFLIGFEDAMMNYVLNCLGLRQFKPW